MSFGSMRSGALFVVLLSACAPSTAATCAEDQFAVGDACLSVHSVRVRRGGVFSALSNDAVTVTKRGG